MLKNVEKLKIYLEIVCYEFNYMHRAELDAQVGYLMLIPIGYELTSDSDVESSLNFLLSQAESARWHLKKLNEIIAGADGAPP